MKKILSIFAFVAMLCIPFSFVSCGDDDDAPKTNIQSGSYSINIQNVNGGTALTNQVLDLIKKKVGDYLVEIRTGLDGSTWMDVKDKTAVNAILKGLGNDKNEFDKLMKENANVMVFNMTVQSNGEVFYEYDYENLPEGIPVSTGTFAYTDNIGTWSFVLTDKDAGDGKKVGSIVVPDGVSEVKAGTYAAKWEIRGQGTVALESDLKQDNSENYGRYVVGLTAGFIAGTKEEGIPVTLVANNKTMFRSVKFKQK